MNLDSLLEFLQALQNGEVYIPSEEWDRYEPVIDRLNLQIDPDLGPGEVGYRPLRGFYIRPR